MQPTVQTLLDRPELALTLLTPADRLGAGALAAPVTWAHSSDLPDPTPFLDAGHVLLTTGTQFEADAGAGAEFADAYVGRLRATGIAALGFGTEVIRAGTPEALVAACDAQGLPLFEVPYPTPFIAIVRTVADLLAEDAYARHTWALAAQRAISLAALRPDGLSATLAELSNRIGAWVGLIDATGSLDREAPAGELGQPALGEVVGEARSMLRRGQRASRTLVAGESTDHPQRMTLQTLGGGGALRGVLAIGDSAELDQAGREVVTSVIALAGLALEQNRDLDRARGHLRSGLLRGILAGDMSLAERVSAEMWGPLPAAPVRIAVTDAPAEHVDRLTELLELRVDERGGRLFFGRDEERVVLVLEEGDAAIADELAAEFELPVGVSDPVAADGIARAHEQAMRALERARESGAGVVAFEEISRQGVLAFLARTDARAVALATLAPLAEHDAANGTDLVATTRAWLEHGGQFDATARQLGVHRHTLRSRIALAERLLGRDLSGFHARADLWAALLAVG
ncbi:PucR family transcriptional regulator ligand-binding domain-containing protein [Agromyces sp. ISL-38]|uniref:PucR family transcriptional regulator n=1 Tax=Agromyces sp. ISL-38 TaxID=2819107 RepID=UPI001BE6FC55|nr:PucR family transcriptional regulator ligand-binding domain-containing protein [Agromyces sp. ISL-38]MBT2500644.1 PucR family transcriptional regulator ligand-binding domain-containing protein [Agromyces sp. ISL-38]MBT2516577.1 PucR family transcriptional regulator ligand-binding domain-containing protein [Streptomyces sp. ISL-90]